VAVAAGTGGGEQVRRYSLAIQAVRIWPLGSASTQAFHVVVNRLWVRRSRPVRSRLRLVHSGSISAAAVVPGHPLGHGGDSGIGKPDQVGMVHPDLCLRHGVGDGAQRPLPVSTVDCH
jgi:hypothetical protein